MVDFGLIFGVAGLVVEGERPRQSGDYAMRDEPSVLKPTKATVAFRDALLQRAAAADHAFAAHDDLLATWRKSLAARDELVRRILRRADAWNFPGKRAKWVEELVASLEAS